MQQEQQQQQQLQQHVLSQQEDGGRNITKTSIHPSIRPLSIHSTNNRWPTLKFDQNTEWGVTAAARHHVKSLPLNKASDDQPQNSFCVKL